MARGGIELMLLARSPVAEPLGLKHLVRGRCEFDNQFVRCRRDRLGESARLSPNLRLNSLQASFGKQTWGGALLELHIPPHKLLDYTRSGTSPYPLVALFHNHVGTETPPRMYFDEI